MRKQELEFIQTLIRRCINIDLTYIPSNCSILTTLQESSSNFLSESSDFKQSISYYEKHCIYQGIYELITPFHLNYYFLCLSEDRKEHLILGPFMEQTISDPIIYELLDTLQLSMDSAEILKTFYRSVPIFETTHIYGICDAIMKKLMQIDTIPEVKELDFSSNTPTTDDEAISSHLITDKVSPQLMEKRYFYENQLLTAVSNGNLSEASTSFEQLKRFYSPSLRTKDPLRNQKNLLITINSLLRKAAETGGVHPIFLNETSTKWGIRLEKTTTVEQTNQMFHQMIRAYCLLVKNHSLAQYSPLVKQALNYIILNLTSDLTVTAVAQELNISADYLTRIFKKEVGVSVIEYINRKRINTSLKLLNTTDLPIQTIGDLVGISDNNYFSKLFKKYIGMSPKQYRESL